jgi:hypothetical protein
VPGRRRPVELSVERPVGGRGPAGAIARLTVTLDGSTEGEKPTPAEISRALEELLHDLDEALGVAPDAGAAGRSDRGLRELVETYRPRQRELVDLLLADGEITASEHALLAASLDARAPQPEGRAPSAVDLGPVGETPIAAVPLSAEPKLPPSRPVPELLRTFQIASLRQAGAVRARRQISFAEYMALKRHFESADPSAEPKPIGRQGGSG